MCTLEPMAALGSWILLSAFAVIMYLSIQVGQQSTTVSRLERKLDLLVKHAGVNVLEVAVHEAQMLVGQGKKIEAIKIYRAYTGATLAEAKAAVERMQEGAGPA